MAYNGSDSDCSDYEYSEIFTLTVFRRKKCIRLRPNNFNVYDDVDFFMRFRMHKNSAYTLFELIGPHIEHPTDWNDAVSAENMFLMTLRLYATGGFLSTIGDLYGVSKATVSNIITHVSHHIAMLRPQFIKFPISDDERTTAAKNFYNISKFPRVIAALDCTHVKIISPGGNKAELYRHRKGFFSINVQTACDAGLQITSTVARWPGSAHDSNIFQNSRICSRFEVGEFKQSLILGDGGYKNTKYLLTPVLNPIKREEVLYNEAHIRTRCCVERSYGVWKRRFPILSLGLRFNFVKNQAIIVATAIIHNICCLNNDCEPPVLSNEIEIEINRVLGVSNNFNRPCTAGYESTRSHLINSYFKNL